MGDRARALTLYPEHAELFRLKLRTIETRSKLTHYRGRLLLHAGVRDEHSAVAQRSPRTRAALDAMPHGDPLTRGAVVASCQLIDCVPMVDRIDTTVRDTRRRVLFVRPDRLTLASGLHADEQVEDQRPFGDFSPGRYAWLLGDVKPTTERCPRCWGTGVMFWRCTHCGIDWTDENDLQQVQPDGHNACPICEDHDDLTPYDCLTCRTEGTCAPVPMRGRQGLWIPKPEDWET